MSPRSSTSTDDDDDDDDDDDSDDDDDDVYKEGQGALPLPPIRSTITQQATNIRIEAARSEGDRSKGDGLTRMSREKTRERGLLISD